MEGSLRASLAASGGSTNRMGRRRRSARDDRAALSQLGGGGELLPAARIAFLSTWRGTPPAPASRLPASGASSSDVLLAARSACALLVCLSDRIGRDRNSTRLHSLPSCA